MKKLLALLGLSFITLACQKPTDQSQLQWAHYPQRNLLGTPQGRLAVLDLEFEANFESLRVCVQESQGPITSEELMTEARLAYAMYLNAAYGDEGKSKFNRFQFELKNQCPYRSSEFAAVIKLGDQNRTEQAERLDEVFKPARIRCNRSLGGISCGSLGGITMGYGGPGAVSMSFFQHQPNRWIKINVQSPATALMSQHVDWVSFETDLGRQDQLAENVKSDLLSKYEQLQTGEDGYDALVGFGQSLASHNLIGAADAKFRGVMNEFAQSGESSLEAEYRPSKALFHVLLHEVGHGFGLDHADHPSPGAVTGESRQATQDTNGVWQTDEATMAYALDYFYLTEDDQLGVKAATDAVIEEYEAHR